MKTIGIDIGTTTISGVVLEKNGTQKARILEVKTIENGSFLLCCHAAVEQVIEIVLFMAGGTHILKEKPDRVRFLLRLHRAPCEKNSQNQNDDRQECEKPLLFLIFFHWKPLSFLIYNHP